MWKILKSSIEIKCRSNWQNARSERNMYKRLTWRQLLLFAFLLQQSQSTAIEHSSRSFEFDAVKVKQRRKASLYREALWLSKSDLLGVMTHCKCLQSSYSSNNWRENPKFFFQTIVFVRLSFSFLVFLSHSYVTEKYWYTNNPISLRNNAIEIIWIIFVLKYA